LKNTFLILDSSNYEVQMSKKLSIFNMKGGVGKSTTAYNIAVGLSRFHDKRILLIDIDPQGNSSAALGIEIWELKKQLKDVLLKEASLKDVVVEVEPKLHLVPTNILMAEQEIPISGLPGRELLLRKAISTISDNYDYVIIDCPPNIGVFSINALMASDGVIIPVDMSYLGLLGISAIERALELIRSALEHPIQIVGVLPTRFDNRNNLSKEVLNSLKKHFGDLVFQTLIPETVKLREAPSHAKSIFDYDSSGKGAAAYKKLLDEVLLWD
jgi:chromosome partitioning protein